MLVLSFLICILLAVIPSIAAPAESNAQRLSRNLPPLRPKFVRNIPGYYQRDVPTAVLAGVKRHNPSPSSTPPSTFSGHIEVRTEGGSKLGNVRNWSGDIGGVDFLDPNGGLQITFTTQLSHPTQFDIIATNANFPPPPFIGLSGTADIGPGSGNVLGFTHVAQTPPGSKPQNDVESAIWSFNPDTKRLTPQWINHDGTKPETIIGYAIRENAFVITGDIAQWELERPNFFISPVQFFLAP